MLSPPKASATADTVIVSEVWLVGPETLWLALTNGAWEATITGASVVEATLPAESVAAARNV